MTPVIITGITGSGKSSLAVDYAKSFDGACIINADASQLYNELKILTAYPEEKDILAVPHLLFGILSPEEKISVSTWKDMAEKELHSVSENHKPIICGGTGFYIDALIHGIADIPSVPIEFRKQVQQKFFDIGRMNFYNELRKLDPETTLHPNDTQRILRAYEIVAYTGKTLKQWWEAQNHQPKKHFDMLVIIPDRSTVAERCYIRLRKMIDIGLKEEITLFTKKYPNYSGALCSALGYREAIAWINNEITQEQFLKLVHIRTMQYAKRQSTWFRNKFPDAEFVKSADEGLNKLFHFTTT